MSEATLTLLPPNWISANLSEIAAINPPLDRCLISDDVPVDFVPMRAVEPEGGGLHRPETASYGKVKKGYTAFLSGDVIMAKITPCMENGKTCVVPVLSGAACFGSTEFHVLRAEPGIEARWVASFLLRYSTRLAAQRQMTGGVGQMRVPAAFLETLVMPVPPNSEQIRILDTLDELLSDLDAGVATLERVRERLKDFRAAVFKAAVEGALTEEWRRQHPVTETADALLARILAERRRCWEEVQLAKFDAAGKAPPRNWKAKYVEPVAPDTSTLPALPDGWKWVSIDQLSSEIKNGYSAKPDATTGIPILRISAVRSFLIDLDDRRYLSGSVAAYKADLIASGDLLFTRYNGSRNLVGVCAVVPKIEESIVHPDKIIRARPLRALGNSEFPGLSANVGSSRRYIEQRIRTTAGQAGISGSDVKSLPVPLPPLVEQAAIMEYVEDQLSVIEHLERDLDTRLKSAEALRQSILRHAYMGNLVPQNPSDEPARDLLKRIATERDERARLARAARQSKTKMKRRRATQD